MIMGISAGLINLYESTSFSYRYSPIIPLMLLTLERRMLGLISEMVALQAEEDVEWIFSGQRQVTMFANFEEMVELSSKNIMSLLWSLGPFLWAHIKKEISYQFCLRTLYTFYHCNLRNECEFKLIGSSRVLVKPHLTCFVSFLVSDHSIFLLMKGFLIVPTINMPNLKGVRTQQPCSIYRQQLHCLDSYFRPIRPSSLLPFSTVPQLSRSSQLRKKWSLCLSLTLKAKQQAKPAGYKSSDP